MIKRLHRKLWRFGCELLRRLCSRMGNWHDIQSDEWFDRADFFAFRSRDYDVFDEREW